MEQDIWKQVLHKLDKIEVGQQKLEAHITSMKSEIADIKKDTARIPYVEQAVSEINCEVVAVSEKVQQLQETVKDQKDIIDVLSARSIEHETKLKHIV